VHKITIVARGRAGGYTMYLPEGDAFLQSREQFEDAIAAMMGGRAAEEIVFNQFTTGASNDLQRATQLARGMVTQYGMSDQLGPRTFGNSGGPMFLGRELYEQRDYSEQAAEEIDTEVKRIVSTAYNRAKAILIENRARLDQLSEALIEQETVERQQFEDIMEGRSSTPTLPPSTPPPAAPPSPAPTNNGPIPPLQSPAPALFSDIDTNEPPVSQAAST
jgi:cell division protease FtsH